MVLVFLSLDVSVRPGPWRVTRPAAHAALCRVFPGTRGGVDLNADAASLTRPLSFLLQCVEAKKHCWYFEGLYPTYYM